MALLNVFLRKVIPSVRTFARGSWLLLETLALVRRDIVLLELFDPVRFRVLWRTSGVTIIEATESV